MHGGWTTQFDHSASFSTGHDDASFINPQYPLAAWPDQAFVDGKKLAQVAPGAVGAGQFAVDYAARTLTIGADPDGHPVQASDLERAFVVQAAGVTLQGFGVRNYATPIPRMGALEIQGKSDVLRDLVVCDNATQGISFLGSDEVGQYLSVAGNGLTGIHANQADGLTLANSVVTGNNSENFNPSPSSGGIKVTRLRDVTITANVVENNVNTKQIWLDESVVGFAITNNTVSGSLFGIDTEISDSGIIANNSVTGGTRGLYVYNTGNVRVYNNSFTGQTQGSIFMSQDYRRQAHASDPGHDPRAPIPDPTDPWVIRNVTIANNTFGGYTSGGTWQIYALDKQTNTRVDRMNLQIRGNYFARRTSNAQPSMVGWGGGDNSTVTRYETPAALAAAKNSSWSNLQPGAASPATTIVNSHPAANAVTSTAVPLPSDIAQAIGQAIGVMRIGAFS